MNTLLMYVSNLDLSNFFFSIFLSSVMYVFCATDFFRFLL